MHSEILNKRKIPREKENRASRISSVINGGKSMYFLFVVIGFFILRLIYFMYMGMYMKTL